ncbi:serine/threonine-protein kinase [Antrihabitans sp. YC2-6]|uniref:serine/threonine-protein kinase n=1 Tax=Antrihabitans sp. YC2-6 TaxID=2799498 RepID=UPI0018F2AAAA|nr:serine/threonine-protein kinase [Antrihabitans sp. YC2-6]MBJ8347413.1 serine/threonine protein kinase [Antrihabitans sp. YC2-6]
MTRHSGPGVGPDYLVAGRYRLRSKLGGGMSSVWLAHDKLLDREVAIKQVASTARLDPDKAAEVRESTIREGRMAAQLSHVHAIAMYDVALDSGEPWLVMEYIPSRSLAQALHITDTLSPFEVAQIGAQVADALAKAHAAGIIHRDIKPGNILVADRGRHVGTVKIGDFGISRAIGDHGERSDMITGTPAYFAPEVARGKDPTEASDVFSLGATLYTAIEGHPPFGFDEDTQALLQKIASAAIIPPEHSAELTDILLDMLEPDPDRRPTMAQVRDTLAHLAAGEGGNPAYIFGVPIRDSDGSTPGWAQRNAVFTERRPNRPPDRPLAPEYRPAPALPKKIPVRQAAAPAQGRVRPKRAEPQAKSQAAPLLIAMGLLLVVILVLAGGVFMLTRF